MREKNTKRLRDIRDHREIEGHREQCYILGAGRSRQYDGTCGQLAVGFELTTPLRVVCFR